MDAARAFRPAAVPSLADVQADPHMLTRLQFDVLVDLQRQLRYLDADIDAAIKLFRTQTMSTSVPEKFTNRVTLTTAEAAEWLGLDAKMVAVLCNTGAIKAGKPGKAWLIRVETLLEWLAGQERAQQAKATALPAPHAVLRRPVARVDALPKNHRGLVERREP